MIILLLYNIFLNEEDTIFGPTFLKSHSTRLVWLNKGGLAPPFSKAPPQGWFGSTFLKGGLD